MVIVRTHDRKPFSHNLLGAGIGKPVIGRKFAPNGKTEKIGVVKYRSSSIFWCFLAPLKHISLASVMCDTILWTIRKREFR